MGVKASGGVRTLEDIDRLIAAGATRIGTSSGVKIVEAARGVDPERPGASPSGAVQQGGSHQDRGQSY
jgi:deoxyribose-phosphate aldolase